MQFTPPPTQLILPYIPLVARRKCLYHVTSRYFRAVGLERNLVKIDTRTPRVVNKIALLNELNDCLTRASMLSVWNRSSEFGIVSKATRNAYTRFFTLILDLIISKTITPRTFMDTCNYTKVNVTNVSHVTLMLLKVSRPDSALKLVFRDILLNTAHQGDPHAVFNLVSFALIARRTSHPIMQPILRVLYRMCHDPACKAYAPLANFLYARLLHTQDKLNEAEQYYKRALLSEPSPPNTPLSLQLQSQPLSITCHLAYLYRDQGTSRSIDAKKAFFLAAHVDRDPDAAYICSVYLADFESYPTRLPSATQCTPAWLEYCLSAATAGHPKAAFALGIFLVHYLTKNSRTRKYMETPFTSLPVWKRILLLLKFGTRSAALRAVNRDIGIRWLYESARIYPPALTALIHISKCIVKSGSSIAPDKINNLRDQLSQSLTPEQRNRYTSHVSG